MRLVVCFINKRSACTQVSSFSLSIALFGSLARGMLLCLRSSVRDKKKFSFLLVSVRGVGARTRARLTLDDCLACDGLTDCVALVLPSCRAWVTSTRSRCASSLLLLLLLLLWRRELTQARRLRRLHLLSYLRRCSKHFVCSTTAVRARFRSRIFRTLCTIWASKCRRPTHKK